MPGMKMTHTPVIEPEYESEEDKKKQEKIRKELERIQDMSYEDKQKEKIRKELERGQKNKPQKRIMSPSEKERERLQIEEFINKGKEKERSQVEEFVGKQKKHKKEVSKLLKDPSIIQQYGPEDSFCANKEHDEPEQAEYKLMLGGLFGEMPPISLCKYCAKLIKLVPMHEKDMPQLPRSGPLRWSHQRHKSSVMCKLKKLAIKLDAAGLYDEANVIDKVLVAIKKRRQS